MAFDENYVIRGGTLVWPGGPSDPADILIKSGQITGILKPGETVAEGVGEMDAQGLHIFPGLIDAHIHFGIAEKVEEYTTETIYAAQGGVSTILGYWLYNGSYFDIFDQETEYASTRAFIDYGFHFGMASPIHLQEMGRYVDELGVSSFKYFMNFRGDAGLYLGLEGTDDAYLYRLLEKLDKTAGSLLSCHTENIELGNMFKEKNNAREVNDLRRWEANRPPITESESCVRAMFLAEKLQAPLYIPHISSKMALDEVRRWRNRYDKIYSETCPHYLTHTADLEIGGLGKANPPFRRQDDVEALWQGLADGTIDVVASDHVPRKRSTKDKPLTEASQGFPGTATILPVLLHYGYHQNRLSLPRISELLTQTPARIFNLAPRKGNFCVGGDADLTFVNLDLEKEVDPKALGSFADYSLYEGQKLKGWPVRTIVRGRTVMKDGEITGEGGYGLYLKRS